jgi:hypothetical protein
VSLGSVLLRPQLLTRPTAAPETRPVGAGLDLITRLVQEVAAGGDAVTIIEEELLAGLEELTAELEPRLKAAETRLTGLLQPLQQLFSDAVTENAGDDFEQIAASGQKLAHALATALQGLTTPKLAELLGTLFDVAEIDLGLTEARFKAFLVGAVERIATRLQADYLGGASDRVSVNRFALGAAVRELRSVASIDLGLPPLNKETLLPPLIAQLQQLGFDDEIGQLAQIAERLSSGLTPATVLQRFFPTPSAHTLLAGANADPKTAWYASWLNDRVIKQENPIDNIDLAKVDFGQVGARGMEQVTFHVAWIVWAVRWILHLRSAIKGRGAWFNVLNIGWLSFKIIGATAVDYATPRWLDWTVVSSATFLGGLFNRDHRFFSDWFGTLLVLQREAEAGLYARWAWLVHESLLSFLTLRNHKADEWAAFFTQAQRDATTPELKAELERVTRIHNHNQIEGWAHLGGEFGRLLWNILLATIHSAKRNYGFPNSAHGDKWGAVITYVLVGSFVFDLGFTYLFGGLLTRCLSGTFADGGRVGRLILKERIFTHTDSGFVNVLLGIVSVGSYLLDHYTYYYTFNEGKTDDGHYSGRDVSNKEVRYAGYPARSTSPYKLPWNKGDTFNCPQGNQGLYSHAPISGPDESFAYDFALNDGTEVLAMRDGVVDDFDEGTPDGDTSSPNKIIILHGPAIADQDRDVDPATGTAKTVRTYAVYLHGQQNSVTAAFGGTAPALGTAVKRGQVIMHADDTGRSAYNHLHVQIKPDVSTTATPSMGDYTIPFVFSDPDVESDDGVPRSGRFYESDNTRVT